MTLTNFILLFSALDITVKSAIMTTINTISLKSLELAQFARATDSSHIAGYADDASDPSCKILHDAIADYDSITALTPRDAEFSDAAEALEIDPDSVRRIYYAGDTDTDDCVFFTLNADFVESAWELEQSLSGDYYRIKRAGHVIYDDSANEDMYDRDSAVSVMREMMAVGSGEHPSPLKTGYMHHDLDLRKALSACGDEVHYADTDEEVAVLKRAFEEAEEAGEVRSVYADTPSRWLAYDKPFDEGCTALGVEPDTVSKLYKLGRHCWVLLYDDIITPEYETQLDFDSYEDAEQFAAGVASEVHLYERKAGARSWHDLGRAEKYIISQDDPTDDLNDCLDLIYADNADEDDARSYYELLKPVLDDLCESGDADEVERLTNLYDEFVEALHSLEHRRGQDVALLVHHDFTFEAINVAPTSWERDSRSWTYAVKYVANRPYSSEL